MRKLLILGLVAALSAGLAAEATAGTERWEFPNAAKITIDGVSGDVVVRPAEGGDLVVELEAAVTPAGAFQPEVRQNGDTIHLEEEWGSGRSSGKVEWTVYLPQYGAAHKLTIDTSSGDLDCEDVALRVDLDTASGDIRLVNVELSERSGFETASGDYLLQRMTVPSGCSFDTASGDFKLQDLTIEKGSSFSTASGDVTCRRCSGDLDLDTASGDVDVRDSDIEGEGRFSSASGNVSLFLARLPEEGLNASSASGEVRLEVADFGDDYTLVLVKRKDRGRISCPFAYTSERTFEDHHVYEERTVVQGSGSPTIELRTASGSVIVER